jgi:hypothetical protein
MSLSRAARPLPAFGARAVAGGPAAVAGDLLETAGSDRQRRLCTAGVGVGSRRQRRLFAANVGERRAVVVRMTSWSRTRRRLWDGDQRRDPARAARDLVR